MPYDPLAFLTRAVDDALQAANDIDPATTNRIDIDLLVRKAFKLETTLHAKSNEAFDLKIAKYQDELAEPDKAA